MHNSTEQEVMDLYTTPSNPAMSSIVDTYLNPEYQYNLQLAALTDSLNNSPISANTTTLAQPSFDLFWALSSPSFPNTTATMPRQSHLKASSPLLPNKSGTESLTNESNFLHHGTLMNSQLMQHATIPADNSSTPLLKYHRSVSQMHQVASHQRPTSEPSIFSHRASLPNIYQNNGKYTDNYSNMYITSTAISSNNNCNHTTPLVTWDQSFERNRHHLRPASTLDESTRKRTKSMDNMNDRQTKALDQNHQSKQLHQPQDHHQFYLEYQGFQNRKQQQLHLQQEFQSKAASSTINALNITGPVSAHEYSQSNIIGTFNSSYHQQSHHETSPSIKSPISPFSSLSTISSTNTTKNPEDDMIDKDDTNHLVEEAGDMNGNIQKYDRDVGSPHLGSEDYVPLLTASSMYSPTVLFKTPLNPPSTCSSSTTSSIPSCPQTTLSLTTLFKQTEYRCSTPGDTDMIIETRDNSATPRRQNPRYDADTYTPRWVRYTGQQKQGYCESCQPMGKWLQLKNSAYWYHKQFFHGISSVSGQPFTSPLEQRINKETDLLEGLCHQCLQYVPICNTKRKNSVLWYRHAHKCHIYDKPKSKSPQQFTSLAPSSL